ncbi:MAG TPA: hypothetical protein VF682_06320 [Pseudomonas sp.]|jgi:hypothetical protein
MKSDHSFGEKVEESTLKGQINRWLQAMFYKACGGFSARGRALEGIQQTLKGDPSRLRQHERFS